MSLLKRLNEQNVAVGTSTPAAPAAMTGAMQTGPVGTGELFAKPGTQAMPAAPATGDLFQNQPKNTGRLVDQSQSQPGRRPAAGKKDSFNEIKSRVQNRLIAELDPRMDLGNADEVRRTVEETFGAVLEAEGISDRKSVV